MIAHRWAYDAHRCEWRCGRPGLGLTGHPDLCRGCGTVVTDEFVQRVYGEVGPLRPIGVWLDDLAHFQATGSWAGTAVAAVRANR